MDHGGMDHGGHDMPMPGHGDHSMACKMNMVWNTDPVGVCLVFPSLQIKSQATVLFWLIGLVLLSMGCEYLRLSLLTFDRNLRSTLRGGGAAVLSSASRDGATTPTRSTTPSGLRRPSGFRDDSSSEEALLGVGATRGAGGSRYWGIVRLPWFVQCRRSLGYAAHVALTFYIMLLVMTYNAQVIGAIILGAFLGHFIFQRNIDLGAVDDAETKGLQCH
ncbi:hypothetical protein JCM6882_003633 [Rhodosporidiobolus microsporus]